MDVHTYIQTKLVQFELEGKWRAAAARRARQALRYRRCGPNHAARVARLFKWVPQVVTLIRTAAGMRRSGRGGDCRCGSNG